jgi:hypothetical protein
MSQGFFLSSGIPPVQGRCPVFFRLNPSNYGQGESSESPMAVSRVMTHLLINRSL